MPIIENLHQNKKMSKNDRHGLKVLMDLVADLTLSLDIEHELSANLTSTELRIAILIRNWLTTDEIAQHMHISSETVKTHRKNIRKRLGLAKSNHNLRGYLQINLNQCEAVKSL